MLIVGNNIELKKKKKKDFYSFFKKPFFIFKNISGSDGLFDNVFDETIEGIIISLIVIDIVTK